MKNNTLFLVFSGAGAERIVAAWADTHNSAVGKSLELLRSGYKDIEIYETLVVGAEVVKAGVKVQWGKL